MVDISDEREVETERRLRRVLAAAVVEDVAGEWRFVRYDGEVAPARALATVSDADGWCALVPADEGPDERFALLQITFRRGLDNSGFVGWLASAIKRATGSGVFVICGDNPDRGGIFDYWGYPPAVAGGVRAAIASLASDEVDPLSLDLRVFRVVATSSASAISAETVFEFREQPGGLVTASYSGGAVVRGELVGWRAGARVDLGYTQLHGDETIHCGRSSAHLDLGGKRLRLLEQYAFADGRTGENVLEAVA